MPSYESLVGQEALILEATEAICEAMEPDQQDGSGKVNRKELADRLGKSKGFITQVLSGERNLTLRTLADLAGALDRKVTIRLEPIPAPPGEKERQVDWPSANTVAVHGFPGVEGDWVTLADARRAVEAALHSPAPADTEGERG